MSTSESDHPAMLENPLGKFSLLVYANPAVEHALEYFKNKLGFNINVLLLASWLAKTGRGQLNQQDIQQATDMLRHWHESITRQLHGLRSRIKDHESPEIRHIEAEIKSHALYAEQVEQNMLYEYFARQTISNHPLSEKLKDLWYSLYHYRMLLKKDLDMDDRDMLVGFFYGIFPYADDQLISEVMSSSTD